MYTCASPFCLRAWRGDWRRSGLKTEAGPGRKPCTVTGVDLRPLGLLPTTCPLGWSWSHSGDTKPAAALGLAPKPAPPLGAEGSFQIVLLRVTSQRREGNEEATSPPPHPMDDSSQKTLNWNGNKHTLVFTKARNMKRWAIHGGAPEGGNFSPRQQPPEYITGWFPYAFLSSLSPPCLRSTLLPFCSPCFPLHHSLDIKHLLTHNMKYI